MDAGSCDHWTTEDCGCCEAEPHWDDRYGCPCCAPVLRDLGLLTLPHMSGIANPSVWDRPDLPPAGKPAGLTVFVNANVVTCDASFSVAEALAIDNGRIVAVGSADDVKARAGAGADVVDAGGRTILPGFIEPHMHFFSIAIFGRYPDVGALTCRRVDDVLARIADLVKETPAGDWVVVRQFDPSIQEGPDEITAAMLDPVSGDTPVFIFNASLHIAYCNTAALRIAGLTAESKDPPGAAFRRDASGAPNGVLQGQPAMFTVLGHNLAAMALEDVPAACARVCEKANAVGITTFCDQATGGFQGPGEIDAYHAFARSGRMGVRMRYSVFNSAAARWDEKGIRRGDGDEMVRATGWKIISDGSNQGRTGLQYEPYLGRDDCGLAYVEPGDLKDFVVKRALDGWQVTVHANGDRAIDNALDAFEAAYEAGAPRELRFRIEHCSVLHDRQIARIKALDVSPSFLIGHVHYWAKAFRDEIFGPEKADLLGRAASCQAAGIPWTIHSDDPVSEMGPLRCIENAVTRSMWQEPGSVLNPAERVSVEDAILAMTRTAAWQCHSEDEIGSLEPGKLADFVVLDADPRKVAPETISQIRVLETWMGGRRVHG